MWLYRIYMHYKQLGISANIFYLVIYICLLPLHEPAYRFVSRVVVFNEDGLNTEVVVNVNVKVSGTI